MNVKLLFVVVLATFCTAAFPAPFITSDPDPTGAADKCVYQIGAAPAVETPVAAVAPSTVVGSCKIDTVSFAAGTTNLQVWFKSTLWGVESAKVPFVLKKPSAGGTGPQDLKIAP